MRKKLSLMAAALAVTACLGASSASAATLYTTAAHTTPVSVGSTFTATMPSGYWLYEAPAGTVQQLCESASLSFSVVQNSAGVFKAKPTSNSFAKCAIGQSGFVSPTGPNELQVSGSSTAVGANTDWLGTTLKGIGWEWPSAFAWFYANFTSASGNPPVKGVFTQQPTVAKAPVSIVLNQAGTVSSEKFFTPGVVSATYTLTGAAASWSFG